MPDYGAIATLIGFLTLLLGVAKVWWDNRTLREGFAALYRVVESNQKVVEAFSANLSHARASDQERIALQKNRLEWEKTKTLGKAFKWLYDNS